MAGAGSTNRHQLRIDQGQGLERLPFEPFRLTRWQRIQELLLLLEHNDLQSNQSGNVRKDLQIWKGFKVRCQSSQRFFCRCRFPNRHKVCPQQQQMCCLRVAFFTSCASPLTEKTDGRLTMSTADVWRISSIASSATGAACCAKHSCRHAAK